MAWVAVIGGATALISGGIGASQGKKAKEEENAQTLEDEAQMAKQNYDQQQMMDVQNSRNALSSYNPQGDAQMYARYGAGLYYQGGGVAQPAMMGMNPDSLAAILAARDSEMANPTPEKDFYEENPRATGEVESDPLSQLMFTPAGAPISAAIKGGSKAAQAANFLIRAALPVNVRGAGAAAKVIGGAGTKTASKAAKSAGKAAEKNIQKQADDIIKQAAKESKQFKSMRSGLKETAEFKESLKYSSPAEIDEAFRLRTGKSPKEWKAFKERKTAIELSDKELNRSLNPEAPLVRGKSDAAGRAQSITDMSIDERRALGYKLEIEDTTPYDKDAVLDYITKMGDRSNQMGGSIPYPYQDQSRTMINPTMMYNKGGKNLLQMVQAGNPQAYWPTQSPNNLNNPGNVGRHRDNMDQRYPGSSQNFQGGGSLLSRVQTGNTRNYWPSLQNPMQVNNPGNVGRHRDNQDMRYPGSSQNFQGGGRSELSIYGQGEVEGRPGVYMGEDGNEFSYAQRPPSEFNTTGAANADISAMDAGILAANPGADVGKSGYYGQMYEQSNRIAPPPEVLRAQAPPNTMTPPDMNFNPQRAPVQPVPTPNPAPQPVPNQPQGRQGRFKEPKRGGVPWQQGQGGKGQNRWGGDRSRKFKGYQAGGSMYDQLQDVSMEEYQSFQNGGSIDQVPGGELEQVSDRAQVVNGDNPGEVDAVQLPEMNASVDNDEVIIDAVDESGQPYKQIFSDTVLVPGENMSMAKKAKSYLKQMPEDESSEQAMVLYQKLDELFEVQQMMNGDSNGENPEEAAAGGMDPNAAAQMGQQGDQAFQGGGRSEWDMITDPNLWRKAFGIPTGEEFVEGFNKLDRSLSNSLPFSFADVSKEFHDKETKNYGPSSNKNIYGETNPNLVQNERKQQLNQYQDGGMGYPSAGYDSALREQQMQVPYPRKNYQIGGKGGITGGDIGSILGSGAKGLGAGYSMGYGFTPDTEGDTNAALGMSGVAQGANALAGPAGNIANQANANSMAEAGVQQQAKIASDTKVQEEIDRTNAAVQGLSGQSSTMGYTGEQVNQDFQNSMQNISGAMGQNTGYEYSGGPINAQNGASIYQNGGMGYQDGGGMNVIVIDAQPVGTTLADLQAYSKPENWGKLDEGSSHRRTSIDMGRTHRPSFHDATPVISGSERGGPTPKGKSFRRGGRLYRNTLNRKSLTLSIR